MGDFGLEAGVGIDLYFEYFKLSPQLRATFGQGNLRVDDGTPFANAYLWCAPAPSPGFSPSNKSPQASAVGNVLAQRLKQA